MNNRLFDGLKNFGKNNHLINNSYMKQTIIALFLLTNIACHSQKKDEFNEQLLKTNEIQRLNDDINFLSHNFPDSLTVGDTLKAEIYSNNPEWTAIQGFYNCSIDSKGIFKVYRNQPYDCLELNVINHRVKIQFIPMASRSDPITIILKNRNGQLRAVEIQLNTHVKEKNGS